MKWLKRGLIAAVLGVPAIAWAATGALGCCPICP